MQAQHATSTQAASSQASLGPASGSASSGNGVRDTLRKTEGFDAQSQLLAPGLDQSDAGAASGDEEDPVVSYYNEYMGRGRGNSLLGGIGTLLKPRMLRNTELEVGGDTTGVMKTDGEGVAKEFGVKRQFNIGKPVYTQVGPFAMKGEVAASAYAGATSSGQGTGEMSIGGAISLVLGEASEEAELNAGLQGEMALKGGTGGLTVQLAKVAGGASPESAANRVVDAEGLSFDSFTGVLEASLNVVASAKLQGAGLGAKRTIGKFPILRVTTPPLSNGKWQGEVVWESVLTDAALLKSALKEAVKEGAATAGDIMLENGKVAAIGGLLGAPGVLAYGAYAVGNALFGESAADKAARQQLDVMPDELKGNRMEDDHIAPTVGGYTHPEAPKEVDPHDALAPRIQAALQAANAAAAPFNTMNAADPSWWKSGALQVWNQGNNKRAEGVQLSQRFKAADDGLEALGAQTEATLREAERLLVEARRLQFGG